MNQTQITAAAFNGRPYSDGTESLVIERLRGADEKIVGHVAFSIVTINGENKSWDGLGTISGLPELQKQGISSKLIREGLSLIREKSARGCVLEGSPEYYQRFSFKTYPDLFYEDAPAPKYFMALPFYDDVPNGKVEFHRAFYASIGR